MLVTYELAWDDAVRNCIIINCQNINKLRCLYPVAKPQTKLNSLYIKRKMLERLYNKIIWKRRKFLSYLQVEKLFVIKFIISDHL